MLCDLGLLGALVYDDGGYFTGAVFPWLLTVDPADAFRLYNVAASENLALATGLTGTAAALPGWLAPPSVTLWPLGAGAGAGRLRQGRAMRYLLFAVLVLIAACREEVAMRPHEPVVITEAAVSHFCMMSLKEHPGPKAQIHLEGQPNPIFFAQVRDGIAYRKQP